MMSRDSIPSFVSNLVKILSNWITWFPYDFQVQYKEGGVAALRVWSCSKGLELNVKIYPKIIELSEEN